MTEHREVAWICIRKDLEDDSELVDVRLLPQYEILRFYRGWSVYGVRA